MADGRWPMVRWPMPRPGRWWSGSQLRMCLSRADCQSRLAAQLRVAEHRLRGCRDSRERQGDHSGISTPAQVVDDDGRDASTYSVTCHFPDVGAYGLIPDAAVPPFRCHRTSRRVRPQERRACLSFHSHRHRILSVNSTHSSSSRFDSDTSTAADAKRCSTRRIESCARAAASRTCAERNSVAHWHSQPSLLHRRIRLSASRSHSSASAIGHRSYRDIASRHRTSGPSTSSDAILRASPWISSTSSTPNSAKPCCTPRAPADPRGRGIGKDARHHLSASRISSATAMPRRTKCWRSPSPTRRPARCASASRRCWATTRNGVWLSTFHSLCARLLRREAPHIGLSRDFVIYDSSDQVAVVKQASARARHRRQAGAAARGAGADQPGQEPDGRARRRCAARGTCATSRSPRSTRSTCRRCKESNALDFDDLLLKTVELFETSAQVRERYAQQVQVRDGRRVPGHQPAAVHADQAARRDPPQPGGRRRSGPVDLQVARRRPAQHPRLRERLRRRARSSASSRTTARRRSSSTRRPRSSSRTATARTSGSGPTARAARRSSTSAAATSSKRRTSSPGRSSRRERRTLTR